MFTVTIKIDEAFLGAKICARYLGNLVVNCGTAAV